MPTIIKSKWHLPSKAHDQRWTGFLMSDLRRDSSNRRQAKCTHCLLVFDNGKPAELFKHVINSCKKITPKAKSSYILQVPQCSKDDSAKQVQPETSTTTAPPIVVNIPSSQSMHHFSGFSKPKTDELHEVLLKALITGNIPFRFLHNHYFRLYQEMLARATYQLPTRQKMTSTILPYLHANYQLQAAQVFKKETSLTLSLDGWTDCSRNSVYAVMLLRGTAIKFYLYNLDLHATRHTANNVLDSTNATFCRQGVDWATVCAVVTDSPAIMVKFRVSPLNYDLQWVLFRPN